MKISCALLWIGVAACGLAKSAGVPTGCQPTVMSEAYWQIWNDQEQARIDRDIEAHRKGDAQIEIALPDGVKVEVKQMDHAFRFGAHAFRIGRQKSAEINRRYEANFVRLFNQATIPFYWRSFEPEPGQCHFQTQAGDLESCFTDGSRDRMDPRSSYLASPTRSTEQFIAFAKANGMTIHGHPLCWGSYEWMQPYWLYEQFCPEQEKAFLRFPMPAVQDRVRLFGGWDWCRAFLKRKDELYARYSEEEIAAKCPIYLANLKRLYNKRVAEILEYCGDRVDSWDVVNESSSDWKLTGGSCNNTKPFTKSWYGILPQNYALEAFKVAGKHASSYPKLSINDYNVWGDTYVSQIQDLIANGARIDMIGYQFHIFGNHQFEEVVKGGTYGGISEPEGIRKTFGQFDRFNKPIHLSEITIPSPDNTPRSLMQQAIVTRNLYRAWFSQKHCYGITWWHTLDGANASGGCESAVSGLMDLEGNPKPAYWALDELINHEWRTRCTATVENKQIHFRGFFGRYELSWRCPKCDKHAVRRVQLLKDKLVEIEREEHTCCE